MIKHWENHIVGRSLFAIVSCDEARCQACMAEVKSLPHTTCLAPPTGCVLIDEESTATPL